MIPLAWSGSTEGQVLGSWSIIPEMISIWEREQWLLIWYLSRGISSLHVYWFLSFTSASTSSYSFRSSVLRTIWWRFQWSDQWPSWHGWLKYALSDCNCDCDSDIALLTSLPRRWSSPAAAWPPRAPWAVPQDLPPSTSAPPRPASRSDRPAGSGLCCSLL